MEECLAIMNLVAPKVDFEYNVELIGEEGPLRERRAIVTCYTRARRIENENRKPERST
jgi:hypothetical protein